MNVIELLEMYDKSQADFEEWLRKDASKVIPSSSNPDGIYRARKIGGSFQHTGTVLVEFVTTGGAERVVFEFDQPIQGMLHVYRKDQIERLAPETATPYWSILDEMMPLLKRIGELEQLERESVKRVLDDNK